MSRRGRGRGSGHVRAFGEAGGRAGLLIYSMHGGVVMFHQRLLGKNGVVLAVTNLGKYALPCLSVTHAPQKYSPQCQSAS